MKNKLTVIVPVYNTKDYLEKCVDSILNQSYKNIELILVDDGSPDGAGQLCDKLKKNDERIVVIHKTNGGLSDARNVGLKNATGDYISFIDSDDYIELNMYSYMMEKMISNNCDMSVCGWFIEKDNQKTKCKFKCDSMVVDKIKCFDMLLSNNGFDNFMCNKIFRRSLFDNIQFPIGRKLEDLCTLYKIIDKTERVYIDDTPFYNYVLRDDSITHDLFKQIDVKSFEAYIERKQFMESHYPSLKYKINSNYFTACRMNLMISYKSKVRDLKFEKEREKELKKYAYYVLFDKSLSLRNKMSFILSSINPKLFFKIRFK